MSDEFTHDVFLSHSAKDKTVVRELAERLRADGLRVWFDEWLQPGDHIQSKIDEGLERSRVLVLCMSANAFGSDWARLEAGTFQFRDPLNKERRFVPLRLDDTPVKGTLAAFLHINWIDKGDDLAYRKLLEACRPSTKTSFATGTRRLLIDEAHRQIEWVGYPTASTGYSTAIKSLDDYVVTTISPGTPVTKSLLEQHHVLMMPMPFGTIVDSTEYQAIAQWVYSGHGLLVLGNYLMEGHHHTNFNQLARTFSLEFSQDLVMPGDREDFRSCIGQSFGTRRELQTVIQPISKPAGHPIISGVGHIAFQSSCTLLPSSDADLAVSSHESLSVMKAVGPKDGNGKIRQIQDYVVDKRAPICFMAGTSHGKGRVLAIGSWKIFLNEFTESLSLDNCKLFQNAITWLASTE